LPGCRYRPALLQEDTGDITKEITEMGIACKTPEENREPPATP